MRYLRCHQLQWYKFIMPHEHPISVFLHSLQWPPHRVCSHNDVQSWNELSLEETATAHAIRSIHINT
jgi:hypothetical protein